MREKSNCVMISVSVFFCLTAVCLTQSAQAAPRITGFSNSKTGDARRMFLVKAGDKITFSVKASGAEKYLWQVNKKVDEKAEGDSFAWTVPNAKGIWEIHLTATGLRRAQSSRGGKEAPRQGSGQAHQEWVVSTLSKKEAPDIFDYFADARFAGRQEADPWGRPPPNWYAVSDQTPPDSSRCYLQTVLTGPPDDEGEVCSTLYHPSDIAFGTWKFRYLLTAGRMDARGGWTHVRLCFIDPKDPTLWPFRYFQSVDAHNYCVLVDNRMDHDCGWAPPRGVWQEIKIVRTPSGDCFTWIDGVFQFRGRELRGREALSLSITLANYRPDVAPEGIMCADMVEVYRNRYLFPPKSVRYGQYIHDWAWERRDPVELDRWFGFDGRSAIFRVPPRPVRLHGGCLRSVRRYKKAYLPVLKKGIVVDGRNVRLQDIATRVRNKALFSYDRKTKTAICAANLVISEGAELVLDGETLKFDCRTDGRYEFAVMFGATLNVKNSTITTTNDHYFVWRLAGITHFGFHAGPLHAPYYVGKHAISDLWYHGLCSVFLNGSTINNCGYLFLSSPMQLDITDTKFTNLHEVDTAEYERVYGAPRRPSGAAKGIKGRFKGKKGFWLGLFGQEMKGFNFRNVSFSGRKSPLDLTFFLNDVDYKTNIYNVNAPAENIVVRNGFRVIAYHKPEDCQSTLGLVNSRFRKIIVPTEMARAVVKYYLNVQVTDASGKAIPDARVKVTNEADNKAYPAESIDGVFVVADYVQDQAGKKEFTHTVEVTTPDGKRASVKGVNPDASWYRADGRKKAMTIKVVMK